MENIKEQWEQFKLDIIQNNRYFSGDNILGLLNKINMLHLFPEGSYLEFYRARIGDFQDADVSELCAPPRRKALAGRCNPDGISYLYLASCEKTAVSEVRPNCGDIVTVAKFKVDVSRIFSFRVSMKYPSIIVNTKDSQDLIRLIDKDLASKVTHESILDYIPLQYVTEYIKKRNYNGFVYSSTVGPGMNLVLFDWEKKFSEIERKKIEINKICYDFDVNHG